MTDATTNALQITAVGLRFRNPIVLASGTAGYGRELEGVLSLQHMGGLFTKAVSIEPRQGAPAPRVAEFDGGMINAVGLANPGVDEVRTKHLPWLARHAPGTRILVNVVGNTVSDFADVVSRIEDSADGAGADTVPSGYELNVSCPNVKAGGLEFGADPSSLAQVVSGARRATRRPIFVKLSPTLQDVGAAAVLAVGEGADGITVVNTIPGLVIDVEHRRPALGFGSGGVSGVGLLPVGVLATWRVRRALDAAVNPAAAAARVPIVGVGGVRRATDVVQYLLAGASLVGIGTAAMQDPRMPERVVTELARWCADHDVARVSDLVGALEWRE